MKKSLLILLLSASIVTVAQTKHVVVTAGISFSPSTLTINVGDTVEWQNTSGSHNVNGTQTTFPSNPASFGNSVGSGWIYSFVFNTAGNYDYQCDPHAGIGMTGAITVTQPSGINDITNTLFQIFPNPIVDVINITSIENIDRVEMFDVKGKEVMVQNTNSNTVSLNIENQPAGFYFIKVISGTESITEQIIKK